MRLSPVRRMLLVSLPFGILFGATGALASGTEKPPASATSPKKPPPKTPKKPGTDPEPPKK